MTDRGHDVGELVDLLGDGTRMRIVRTLWEEFDFGAYVTESREPWSFSELFDATGVEDSGNFNYHLGRLAGVLVADREDGYVLTPLGYHLMRSIDRYADFSYETREERTLDAPCPYCGGTLRGEYRRGMVAVRCRDCGGLAEDGNVAFVEVLPSGTADLSFPALLDAATLAQFARVRAAANGFCESCHGPMDLTFDLCHDHDRADDGVCPDCRLRYRSRVVAECSVCGGGGRGPLLTYATADPALGGFLSAAGRGPGRVGPWRYRLAAHGSLAGTTLSTDPVRAELTFEAGGGRCRVTVENDPDARGLTLDRELLARPSGPPRSD